MARCPERGPADAPRGRRRRRRLRTRTACSRPLALAEAGWRVLVLEAADRPGGGLRTEEVTLPGFRHDICSDRAPDGDGVARLPGRRPRARGPGRSPSPASPVAHPMTAAAARRCCERDVGATAAASGDGPRWARVIGALAGDADRMLAGVADPTHLPPRRALWTLAVRAPRGSAPRDAGSTGWSCVTTGPRTAGGPAAHSMLALVGADHRRVGMLLRPLGHARRLAVRRGRLAGDRRCARRAGWALGGEVRCGHRVRSTSAELPAGRAVLFDVTPRQLLAITGHGSPAATGGVWSGGDTGRASSRSTGRSTVRCRGRIRDWPARASCTWAARREVIAAERTVARGGIPSGRSSCSPRPRSPTPAVRRRAGTPAGATATCPTAAPWT